MEQANQLVKSKHTLSGTFKSCFVEQNLVHIHSEVEEVGKYTNDMKALYMTNCCKCCNISCCPCVCCPKCFTCCQNSFNSWEGQVISERDASTKLNYLLVQPWETQEEGMSVRLPGQVNYLSSP